MLRSVLLIGLIASCSALSVTVNHEGFGKDKSLLHLKNTQKVSLTLKGEGLDSSAKIHVVPAIQGCVGITSEPLPLSGNASDSELSTAPVEIGFSDESLFWTPSVVCLNGKPVKQLPGYLLNQWSLPIATLFFLLFVALCTIFDAQIWFVHIAAVLTYASIYLDSHFTAYPLLAMNALAITFIYLAINKPTALGVLVGALVVVVALVEKFTGKLSGYIPSQEVGDGFEHHMVTGATWFLKWLALPHLSTLMLLKWGTLPGLYALVVATAATILGLEKAGLHPHAYGVAVGVPSVILSLQAFMKGYYSKMKDSSSDEETEEAPARTHSMATRTRNKKPAGFYSTSKISESPYSNKGRRSAQFHPRPNGRAEVKVEKVEAKAETAAPVPVPSPAKPVAKAEPKDDPMDEDAPKRVPKRKLSDVGSRRSMSASPKKSKSSK